jgi:hypothetical protein
VLGNIWPQLNRRLMAHLIMSSFVFSAYYH